LSLGQWRKIDLINFVPYVPRTNFGQIRVPEQKFLFFSRVTLLCICATTFFYNVATHLFVFSSFGNLFCIFTS